MIIGVIASMTIPSLKKNTDLRENAARLKKDYSSLSNVVGLLEQEYGPVRYWKWGDDETVITKMFIPHLNVIKNCKTQGGCYGSNHIATHLNGNSYRDYENDKSLYTFTTADGAFWAFNVRDKTCSTSDGDFQKGDCASVHIDVNGGQPPNRIGIDIFGFSIRPDGVYPFGSCPNCTLSTCSVSSSGWACSAKVIMDGEIKY